MNKIISRTNYFSWYMQGSFLAIVFIIVISAPAISQGSKAYRSLSTKISLKLENGSLKEALKKISNEAAVSFAYSSNFIPSNEKISIQVKEEALERVLKKVLYPLDLGFQVSDEIILIENVNIKNKHLSENPETSRQDREIKAQLIKGKVTDSKSQPLAGVSVHVKGSALATTTDESGEYSINAPENGILIFSFVGYEIKEVAINSQLMINVEMKGNVEELGEVIITGYSAQRKKDITGAVAVVDMKAMKSIPAGSASQALQGQASGVNVISSGAPGGRNDIFIRGVTSFGNTQPLIIIDGVQGDLNNLNINDIESMQVLKDAGAASIYGVRGSNGVIVVTTKKGKTGQPILSYDSYLGIQNPPKGNVFDLLNSEDYARLYKEVNPGTILFTNGLPDYTYAGPGIAGTAMEGDPAVDPAKYNFDAANPENDYLIQKVNKSGTDWFHEIFKPALMQSHNLTASGGTDKAKYLFSLGYLNQQGTLIETYLKRYSARINTQFNVKNNIRIGQNAYVYYKQNPGFSNLSEGNAISLSYRTLPIIPVHDINGNYGGTWLGPELGTVENAVAVQERTRNNRNNVWNITGNAFAEIDFLKHFTVRTSFGGTILNQYSFNFGFNTYNDKQAHTLSNSFNENALYNSSYTWTNTLNYNQVFGQHNVKVLIGSEAIKGYGRGVGGGARNFFSSNLDYLVLNNGTSNITNYSNAFDNSLFSLFSRLDYSYKDKYLLGATIRRDGSSVFGSDKRYGVFPSFSLGWRLSNETFMKDVTFINDLKLRGSYGILGSQANVNASNAFTLFSSGFGTSYYDISGSGSTRQGFFQSNIGNPNTEWEEDVITNLGFDVTVLNNKLDFSFEWYKKSINGLLFPQPLPATTGDAAPPTINIGDIQNKGWDFSAAYRGQINNELQYRIGLNFTSYKNIVYKIPAPGYFDVAGSRIGNLVRNQEGYPVGSFFGYEVVGLFKNEEEVSKSPEQTDAAPGRFKYRDINGDNKITPADRTFFGDPNPDFTYGINLSINYKNFDFSSVLYGSQGNDVINFVRYYTNFFGTSEGKGRSNVLKDAWTPKNQNTSVPIAEYTSSFSTNGVFNSYYKEDGSFLKLRSVILGYTINPTTLKKYGISNFRAYIQAANLLTITKYTGLDPELTGSLGGNRSSAAFGIDYGNYPNNQKNFLIGINVTF